MKKKFLPILTVCLISAVFLLIGNFIRINDKTHIIANIHLELSDNTTKLEIHKNDTFIKAIDINSPNSILNNITSSIKSLDEFIDSTTPEYTITFLDDADKKLQEANIYILNNSSTETINSFSQDPASKLWELGYINGSIDKDNILTIDDSKYAIAVIEYNRYFKTEYMVIGLNDYILG